MISNRVIANGYRWMAWLMNPLQYPLPHGRLLAPVTDGVGDHAPWGQVKPDGPDEIPKEVKSSQVTFIYIAPLTIQIVTKHCTISK